MRGIGERDLDAAITVVCRLPEGAAGRGERAAELVEAVIRDDPTAHPGRLRALDRLLALADADPPRTAHWRRWRAAGRATSLTVAAAENRLPDLTAALAELDALAADAADEPALRPVFASARLSVEYGRAVVEGDIAAMTRLTARFQALDAGPATPVAVLGAALGELIVAQQTGAELAGVLDRIRTAAAALPAGHHLRTVARDALAMAGHLDRERPGGLDPEAIADLASGPGFGFADRTLVQATAALATLAEETDPQRISAVVGEYRAALERVGSDDPQRAFHLAGLALGLFRQGEVGNSVAPLAEAESILVTARQLAGGPHHPQWPLIVELLSEVRDRRGTTPDPQRGALDAMRAHVWQVLKQPDLASARIAARYATSDAVAIARRCLVAGDIGGAVQALDAGRGLALFAATERRDVGDRLAAAGRHDLAARWRAAAADDRGAGPPDELRREMLHEVYGERSAAALLDPPGPAEISAALQRIDADVLVYLMPGDGPVPGYAVLAAATGGLSYLPLPGLHLAGAPDVEAYLAAAAHRDAAVAAPRRDLSPQMADRALAGCLHTLCDWAWRAAIGPLVDGYLPRTPVPAARRPHRIVLVPMGELARIPWQAARRPDGAYALQFIAISQVASARMLCRSAALAPVESAPLGLVVGDPDTGQAGLDLPAARAEAYAVHRQFYLGARYVGRRPDGSVSPSGPGTAEQIRAWLTATGPAAGAMLHLACHAMIRTDPGAAMSYLLLAGDQRLAVDELIHTLAGAPDRAIGLVVLAACSTGLSVDGYDEAYSLGTAFLAAGVRSVLFTQWRIPDASTSVLMYMFHRYRMIDRRPIWDALRRAQLWLLDDARDVPSDMPASLREQLDRAGPAAVLDWAGFVHGGQ